MFLMSYNYKLKIVISTFTVFFICVSCYDENIVDSTVIFDNLYIIDTLDVNITYEDTPGFKYPMMKHYVNTVTRLTEKGSINDYEYNCDQGDVSIFSSYSFLPDDIPNYKFRNEMTVWSSKLIEPNTIVSYTLLYISYLEDGSNYYTHISNVKVNYSNTGIKPENNSIQLTGPNNRNYSPRFSNNGEYIFYQSSHDKNSIFKTDLNGENYEEIQLFEDRIGSIGLLEITNNNELVYVIWKPNIYSKIVIIDLDNMQRNEFVVNGFLWGTRPINIPNTKKYLNALDHNSANDFKSKLLLADIETQKVDTLLSDTDYQVEYYTLNPVNKKLYLTVHSGDKFDIVIFDYYEKTISNFLTNVEYRDLRFFPNGHDYGYLKYDENRNSQIYLNINGQEKQLTKYPGDIYDFDFSPNGKMIVFGATRRGEVQSWLMKL